MRWFLLLCMILCTAVGGCSTDDEWNDHGGNAVNLAPRNHEQP
jgi:hypothetical protein